MVTEKSNSSVLGRRQRVLFASAFSQLEFALRSFAKGSHNFLACRVIRQVRSKDVVVGKSLILIASSAIFSGGILLLLLGNKSLAIGQPNIVSGLLGDGSLRFILLITGLALVVSSFLMFPYVKRILNGKQTIRFAASHHVRNMVQQVLLSLELLELEGSTTQSQKERICRAEKACNDLIESLSMIETKKEKLEHTPN